MPATPSATQRLFGAVRTRTGDRTKRAIRKIAGRPLVAWERRSLRPVLTVVMPVYNVDAYLREALDTVLTQSLRNLEVIAVDDGSTDTSLEILREFERRDARVRVFTQANAGQGIARNLGVSLAKAEFLTFIDSDDTVPPQALEHMVQRLQKSGSDFCVGGVRRFRGRQYRNTVWQRTVHQTDRIGTTIDEFPAAMQDIIACNRMFRTAFWRERIGDFRAIAYEDHVPMLAAYVRATKFDVLTEITYNWRIREGSTGHLKAQLQNLLDRVEVKREAHELLKAEASQFVYDVWVARCIEVDFGPFIGKALDADDEYRETLRAVYQLFTSRANDDVWDRIRVLPKIRAHLVAEGRWDDVDEATQWFLSVHDVPPTRVVDGVLTAVLPQDASWAVGLPEHLLRMAPLESHFEGAIQQVTWPEPVSNAGHVELTGWMRHRALDVVDAVPAMTLALVSGDTEVPVPFEHLVLPEANQWAPLPYAGCANAGFRARIPIADLAPGQPWQLVGSITGQGLTSSGSFHYPIAGSSGADPRPRDLVVGGGGGGEKIGVRPGWDPALGFCLRLRAGGLLHPPKEPSGPLVEQVEIGGDFIVIRFSGATESALRTAALGNARTRLELVEVIGDVARFSNQVTEFGSVPHVAPSADYTLTVNGIAPQVGPDFASTLPVRLVESDFGLTLNLTRSNQLRIALTAAHADDELGRFNQFRLHAAYRASKAPLQRSMLLASYLGEFATDSQLAIDRHLAEHHPDIERIWGVAGTSTLVPDGARSVVIGSAAWYEAVATSRFHSKNIDFGAWYRTRPGQAYLQTFHGYPFKSMGLDFWRSKGWNVAEIRQAIRKVQAEWDLILVPSAECEAYYRESFLYEGPVLVAGYPRTDVLVNADAAEVRRTVLARIGVPEEKTVVLYAPTYRDSLTTKLYAAARFDELDLKLLTDALGEEYVVLVRGHNNNQREDDRVPRAGSVVDVTDYPDINELTLAADAAILDYSSLRFDWAITGKPIVFFVPDVETYFGQRPPLFSFEDSAPGPWARTTTEVAAALVDLAGLRDSYSTQIEKFNQRFNYLHDGRATERVLATLLDESTPWRQN